MLVVFILEEFHHHKLILITITHNTTRHDLLAKLLNDFNDARLTASQQRSAVVGLGLNQVSGLAQKMSLNVIKCLLKLNLIVTGLI